MKYEVYLTKSHEVAAIIAKAFKLGEDGVESVGHGVSTYYEKVPAIYQSENMFCCVVRYNGDADVQPYRLIIA